jgi:hypothetical protein
MIFRLKKEQKCTEPKYLNVVFCLKENPQCKWKIIEYDRNSQVYYRSNAVVENYEEGFSEKIFAKYTSSEIDNYLHSHWEIDKEFN